MELTQKGEMVSRLQAKAGQIGKILNNLEKYNHLLKESDRRTSDKKHVVGKIEAKEPQKKIESSLDSDKKLEDDKKIENVSNVKSDNSDANG